MTTIENAIKKIILVCNDSIATDEAVDELRQPIGRSDTYMIRNTLQSCLNRPESEQAENERLKKRNKKLEGMWKQATDVLALKFPVVCDNVLNVLYPKLQAELAKAKEENERLKRAMPNEPIPRNLQRVKPGGGIRTK